MIGFDEALEVEDLVFEFTKMVKTICKSLTDWMEGVDRYLLVSQDLKDNILYFAGAERRGAKGLDSVVVILGH